MKKDTKKLKKIHILTQLYIADSEAFFNFAEDFRFLLFFNFMEHQLSRVISK